MCSCPKKVEIRCLLRDMRLQKRLGNNFLLRMPQLLYIQVLQPKKSLKTDKKAPSMKEVNY